MLLLRCLRSWLEKVTGCWVPEELLEKKTGCWVHVRARRATMLWA